MYTRYTIVLGIPIQYYDKIKMSENYCLGVIHLTVNTHYYIIIIKLVGLEGPHLLKYTRYVSTFVEDRNLLVLLVLVTVPTLTIL